VNEEFQKVFRLNSKKHERTEGTDGLKGMKTKKRKRKKLIYFSVIEVEKIREKFF
jgi:hypothetical protein